MDKDEISNRIQFLLRNQILAVRGLNGLDNYFSNCHGTAAYVLGVQERFRKWVRNPGEFLETKGRPSYVDRDLMNDFIENECVQLDQNYKFGDLAILWSPIHRATRDNPGISSAQALELPPVKTIEHTSVLVNPKTELAFHQRETGREFEFARINTYIAELFPNFRKRGKNLFVEFYRVKDQ